MRIVRFLGDDGHPVLGEAHPNGDATLLLDAGGFLEAGQEQRAIRAMLHGRRALIADDDEGIRNVVGEVCRKLGCDCVVCHEGGEAMDALAREPIDLVVSDIVMPNHDGYEVFAAAKAKNERLPVVLITGFGYDPGHQIVRASKRGLEGVLFKPFTPQQLVDSIGAAMRPTAACASGMLVRTPDRQRMGSLHAPLRPREVFVQTEGARGDEFVMRPSSTVQDPFQPIRVPKGDGWTLRAEARLAVVLAAKIGPDSPMRDAVLGYMLATHVTATRSGGAGRPSLASMGFDTSCPLGPALLTPDSLPCRADAVVTMSINGAIRERIAIADYASRVESALRLLSERLTLNAGSVLLLAGTDDGGAEPGVVVQAGDRVMVEMEGIGRLENPIVSG